MRPPLAMTVILSFLALACQKGSSPEPMPLEIALEGQGGEAWTFEKRLAGSADEGCLSVEVASPRGRVVARREGGRFSAIVPLAAGDNMVRALCLPASGGEVPSAPQTWTVRLQDRPTAWPRVTITDQGVQLDGGASRPSPVRAAELVGFRWQAHEANPQALEAAQGGPLDDAHGDRVTVKVPRQDGEYLIHLIVTDQDGVTDRATAIFKVEAGEALRVDLTHEHAAWVDRAIVYGVAPFFFPGGGFAGVTERLADMASLGSTAIWLSPVTGCPADDFGYAVTDHFALRQTFGSEAEFTQLIEEAHGLGLRVMMDFVPNHTSHLHPYFQDAQSQGVRSPYYGFYEWREEGAADYYFDWNHLPNLDYDSEEVANMMVEAFSYWVREHDIDGFRADVSWGVAQRAPEFWPRLRAELKRVKPDIFLLAEATARDDAYFDNGFDGAYDWTWELGEWAWQEAFDAEGGWAAKLTRALTNEGEGYGADALIFRFLENNDTAERFITRHGPQAVLPAAAMLLTLPGLPCLYTGQEIGAEFLPYNEGPELDWRQDPHQLRERYARLTELRRDLAALRSPSWALLPAEPAQDVLAYVRISPDGPETSVLVVLNFSDEALTASVTVTADVEPLLTGPSLTDLFDPSYGPVAIEGSEALRFNMVPHGAMVLGGEGI